MARRSSPLVLGGQRSFDDLGTPLSDVTFCVVDVETTGGSATDGALTEIGAVKVRGGEVLGTFQTLVDPGRSIDAPVVVLTGITEALVRGAPRVEAVLPAFSEFVAGTVLVGHNVRYDLSFLDAALVAAGWPRLANRCVDTVALARRLIRDDVPNLKLGTLASRLRLAHQPSHRALDDALATTDLLHALLERAGSYGVTGLDDLLALPSMEASPHARKLRLTTSLPRSPGVYLFRDRAGRVLYVGKATDLRQRVRSYFSGDERRKVGQLLREAEAIDHVPCATPLEAAVLEVRLIQRHEPRFNRQLTHRDRYVYVTLTLDEAFPRLKVSRSSAPGPGLHLGPLPSTATARRVIDALHLASPVRRCTQRGRGRSVAAPCAPAQLGVAACPCSGHTSPEEYASVVAQLVEALTRRPATLLERLRARLGALAQAGRYEEAADLRDAGAALSAALRRQDQLDRLRTSGRVRVSSGGHDVELTDGVLATRWDAVAPAPRIPPPPTPIPKDACDELACVARWLEAQAPKVSLLHCDGELAQHAARLPTFQPRRGPRPAGSRSAGAGGG